jgi:hypothetical protein
MGVNLSGNHEHQSMPPDYDKRAADTIARRIRDAEPYVSV